MKKIIYLFMLYTFSLFLLLNCSDDSSDTPVTPDANHPPVIYGLSVEPSRVLSKATVQFTCDAGDRDEDELSFEWRTDEDEFLSDKISFTWKTPHRVHDYYLTCKVEDGNGGSDIDTIKLSVYELAPNEAPTINAIELSVPNVDIGDTSHVFCNAIDYDNNLQRYDLRLRGVGEVFSHYGSNSAFFRGVKSGSADIRFIVIDEPGFESIADTIINTTGNETSNDIVIPAKYPVIDEIIFPDTINVNEETILECKSVSSEGIGYACDIVKGLGKISYKRDLNDWNKFKLTASEPGEYLILIEGSFSTQFFTQKVIKVTAVQ